MTFIYIYECDACGRRAEFETPRKKLQCLRCCKAMHRVQTAAEHEADLVLAAKKANAHSKFLRADAYAEWLGETQSKSYPNGVSVRRGATGAPFDAFPTPVANVMGVAFDAGFDDGVLVARRELSQARAELLRKLGKLRDTLTKEIDELRQLTNTPKEWDGTDEQIVEDAERRYAGLMPDYPKASENPCMEINADLHIDWKRRYERLCHLVVEIDWNMSDLDCPDRADLNESWEQAVSNARTVLGMRPVGEPVIPKEMIGKLAKTTPYSAKEIEEVVKTLGLPEPNMREFLDLASQLAVQPSILAAALKKVR